MARQLSRKLEPLLETEQLASVNRDFELPLVDVLADIERAGIRVDTAALAQQGALLENQLLALTARIHELAGGEFNISSPKQLGEVLFERLNLPVLKKTGGTRSASTAVEVLEELALTHELPKLILEFRGLHKLKGTYVDALPLLVNPDDRPRAHELQPGGGRDRPPEQLGSQPAEHPDPHRDRPPDPQRLHRRARATC